ncbi:MAG: FliO/MopB family protein [Leptospiraceae bacterium]|nr:FliO/MopB family protein [Leptospiraceae bacterium]
MISKTCFSLVLFFSLVFNSSIFSQASGEEDLDKALRNELGQEEESREKKKSNTKQTNPPPTKNVEEKDPIRERYAVEEESSSTLLWILVKISLVLAILVGAFYYILQYLSKNKISRYPVQGEMKILSSIPVGPGKELQMVEISGMILVIGVSENSISMIKEIDDVNLKEKIFSARDSYEPPTETFVDYFLNSVKSTKKPDIFKKGNTSQRFNHSEEEYDDRVLEELQLRQKERLEKLKKERNSLLKKDYDDNEGSFEL